MSGTNYKFCFTIFTYLLDNLQYFSEVSRCIWQISQIVSCMQQGKNIKINSRANKIKLHIFLILITNTTIARYLKFCTFQQILTNGHEVYCSDISYPIALRS